MQVVGGRASGVARNELSLGCLLEDLPDSRTPACSGNVCLPWTTPYVTLILPSCNFNFIVVLRRLAAKVH